jgi:hypothetical protein
MQCGIGWINIILNTFNITPEQIGLSCSDVWWLDLTMSLCLMMPLTSRIIMYIRNRKEIKNIAK